MNQKLFVFFTYTIKRVGGAQLYIKAKADYLQQQGWTVMIVYNQDGESYIKELQKYKSLYIPKLFKPSYLYLEGARNRIVKKIVHFLNTPNDEVVIESHSRILASWAEIVAKKKGNVRHIAFDLDECISIPKPMLPFYKFKYNRHELFGITDKSIELLFQGTGVDLFYGSSLLLAYGASDCIYDSPSAIPLASLNGYVIGVVGRLEKTYVYEYAQNLAEFAKTHAEEDFSFVFVGGAPEGNDIKSRIESLLKPCKNVNLFFTGYMFPIPRELVLKFNICLAGAGAAYALKREGVATIIVDPRDGLSGGVLGITVQQGVFSDDKKKPVLWWMEEVYKHPEKYVLEREVINYDFSSHIDILEDCEKTLSYDLSFLNYRLSLIDQTKRVLNSILPLSLREVMATCVRGLKHKY